MRTRRKLIDALERTIYLKPITEMLEIEENKVLGEIKEKKEGVDEDGRLMLKEGALKNLVLDFYKARLNNRRKIYQKSTWTKSSCLTTLKIFF